MPIKRALRKCVFTEKMDKMLLSIAITVWLKCEVICFLFFLKRLPLFKREPEKIAESSLVRNDVMREINTIHSRASLCLS